jgi:hypothetical protein
VARIVVQYLDVSHYQDALSLKGALAALAKATQGTSYVDPAYAGFKAQAHQLGIPFAAYHWLDTTDAAAQAAHAFSVVGPGVVLMIDDEQNVINVAHTLAFVAAYRKLGGCVRLEYAPRWVWSDSGQPDLRPLAAAGLGLISSAYPPGGYSDTGIGWLPYGGVTPMQWQWTDAHPFNGQLVDFNAFDGTLAELTALFTPGDDMALADDLDGFTMMWRVHGLVAGEDPIHIPAHKPTNTPAHDEPNMLQRAVKAAGTGSVPSAAEIAKAVNDDEAKRMQA